MIGIKFIKAQPNIYLLQYAKGRVVREGVGLAFFYYAPTTSLVAVPVASTESPFIFQEVTADFQTVSIQGQVTYRVADAKKLATLMNFTLGCARAKTRFGRPAEIAATGDQCCQRAGAGRTAKHCPLREAVRASDSLVQTVHKNLAASGEMSQLGLEILGLNILAIKPTPETARALEAEAREQLLKEADEAIYSRRNSAVEQERAIKENELNTEIAVENKKRQIRETQMDAERAVQEKQHQLEQAGMAAKVVLEEKRKQLVTLATQNSKAEADARAYGISNGDGGIGHSGRPHLAGIGQRRYETRTTHCGCISGIGR